MSDLSKIGYGNKDDIPISIKDGKIDELDLIVTKDTSELLFVTDELNIKTIKSRIPSFETIEIAEEFLNAATDTYCGELVTIKSENGNYELFIVQFVNKKYKVESVMPDISSNGSTWQKL